MWTRFMDMHSGGAQKLSHGYILIEASQKEAEIIFQNRFNRNPHRVTCTCCGEDYSIDEHPTLEQATAYDRGCDWAYFRPDGSECPESEGFIFGKGMPKGYTGRYVERKRTGPLGKYASYRTLEEYIASGEALIIYAHEIHWRESQGELREEGYVWRGDE